MSHIIGTLAEHQFISMIIVLCQYHYQHDDRIGKCTPLLSTIDSINAESVTLDRNALLEFITSLLFLKLDCDHFQIFRGQNEWLKIWYNWTWTQILNSSVQCLIYQYLLQTSKIFILLYVITVTGILARRRPLLTLETSRNVSQSPFYHC